MAGLGDGMVDGGPARRAGEQRYPARTSIEGVPIVLLAEAAPGQHQAGREHVHQVQVVGDEAAAFRNRIGPGCRRLRAVQEIGSPGGASAGSFFARAGRGLDDAQEAGLFRSGHPAPLGARGETPRCTETGEAPARQGATRENIEHIRPRSNAVRRDAAPVECSGDFATGSSTPGPSAAGRQDRPAGSLRSDSSRHAA